MRPISPSSRLCIAIVGAGRIGTAIAFQLSRIGNHDITLIARPSSVRFQQLQRDKGIVKVDGERAEVRVTDTLDEVIPYELVLVTVLAHQVEAVLPELHRSSAKCIQCMFNNFEPEVFRERIGAERVAFGFPFFQADFNKDGRLKTTIGAFGQKCLMDHQRWVDLFNEAGLPTKIEPNMTLWLRCQVPLAVAFESVSVVAVRRGGGASWSEAMVIARGMQESFGLIKGLGHQLYPQEKVWLDDCPTWMPAVLFWSLSRINSFRELLATGLNECRALIDAMIANAPKANPPVNVAFIQAMKPLE